MACAWLGPRHGRKSCVRWQLPLRRIFWYVWSWKLVIPEYQAHLSNKGRPCFNTAGTTDSAVTFAYAIWHIQIGFIRCQGVFARALSYCECNRSKLSVKPDTPILILTSSVKHYDGLSRQCAPIQGSQARSAETHSRSRKIPPTE